MFDPNIVIGHELQPGEELLWSAQPKQGLTLRKEDHLMIPFSIFWIGFAAKWEYEAVTGDAPMLLVAIGAVFIVIGLQFSIGRFFKDAALREKTFYGITNRRVIILSGIKEKQGIYLPLSEIAEVRCPDDEPGLLLLDTGYEDAPAVAGILMPRLRKPIYCFDNLADTDTPRRTLEQLLHI